MHSSDIEMRSPALTSMSYSRGGWAALTSSASRMRSSVVFPMALTTATTASPGPRRPGDVIGHGPDAIGVADRGPAELLDEQRPCPSDATGSRRGSITGADHDDRPRWAGR